ncbi:MAG: fumarate hydratase, partial [Deltaproteobacteria bacterium]|nr:fumarate hydratase [Deltaproteobacteria bacterium]
MANKLNESILELIRKTSTELPKDVADAVHLWQKKETPGSRARYAMDIICENLKLAGKASQPICQDTGSILFFIKAPVGFNQAEFEEAAKWAVAEATAKGYLRQNSVDSLTGKNSGNNLGPGFPHFHFEQYASPSPLPLSHQGRGNMVVKLILKGGGCENYGAQYSLQEKKL